MAQQTAVEWLMQNIEKTLPNFIQAWGVEFEQAKQMEKEQIMKSFKSARIPYKYDADFTLNGFENAEQYYNETYGKDSNESNA